MEERMRRFLESIGIKNADSFDMDFQTVFVNQDGEAEMHILKETPWNFDYMNLFVESITKIPYPHKIIINYKKQPSSNDIILLFDDWYERDYFTKPDFDVTSGENSKIYVMTKTKDAIGRQLVINEFNDLLKIICYGYRLELFVTDEQEESPIIDEPVVEEIISPVENDFTPIDNEELKKEFDEENGRSFDSTNTYGKVNHDENDEEDDVVAASQEKELADYEELLLKQMEENRQAMIAERARQRSFRKGDYIPVENIQEIRDRVKEDINVDFVGEVFELNESKLRKREGIKLDISLGDESSAIVARCISNKNTLNIDKLKTISKGMNVRVRGYAQNDAYSGTNVLVHYIDLLPPKETRKDTRENKRVELHLHTKFSAFDGLGSIEQYCKLAKSMGHKAIAVTDHGVAQAYPEAQSAEKKTGVRIIYGSELYMVDNVLECALNPQDIKLDNATYVVLDFETTGLSAKYDQILEFGAWRYEKGMMVKSIDLFVKPTIEISEKITELTGITKEMANGGVSIKEAITIMEDFCKDAILVTHNAKFDIGFMNQARINNGYATITNPVIDTLAISRYLFPTSKLHRLGNLAKNLDITSYNEDEAHRADFDAKVLGDIWMAILSILTRGNLGLTHKDLADFKFSNELLTHYRPSHVTVLCKDAVGLKDLYKLISLSHIEYFANVPRVPRTDLVLKREHLLLGSSCLNGEIWDLARTKTEKELVEAMKFYDFIEIQPPANFHHLVCRGEMTEEEIERTIRDIINAAKLAGKPVCVTGDVHYVNPEDKIYRDVYICTKGIGGTAHPLFRYKGDYDPSQNPIQYYRSTDEMFEAFPFLSDEEKEEYIVTNTNKIADLCSPLKPVKSELYKPTMENSEENLRKTVFDKAKSWYGDPLPKLVEDRLEKELAGICGNGYAVTYTIARAIILKAHEDGFIVGSRGSVGSSFVATMADITEINPLPPHYRCPKCRHVEWVEGTGVTSGFDLPDKVCPVCGEPLIHDGQNIPFETFLGFHADKVPDIDLNFPPDYQAKAHDYTKVLFGEQNVFRAGTIGTVADKTAFGYVRKYFETIKRNPDEIPSNYIAYLASKCVDVKRTTGQHPGGIVVVPKEYDVYDFCPIQYPADETDAAWKTTHFEFKAIHDTLLKLDLLGHDDPMMIKKMCELVGLNYRKIPLNDPDVLSLFSKGDALKRQRNFLGIKSGALGLPEFGTNFVRGILDDTKPTTFTELVIISGLSHGTDVWQGNAEMLIRNKTCTLMDVIGCRDDIMIYLLSKGVPSDIAFKTMEDVRKGKMVKPEYAEELRKHDVPEYYIESCNKIKYMFPKAHACAYVTNALRIAYFKVHFPLVYYAIYFTIRCDKFDIGTMAAGEQAIVDKITALKKKKVDTDNHSLAPGEEKFSDKDADILDTLSVALELYERGFKIQCVNLYKSQATDFTVDKETNSIIPPFTTIDNLGSIAANTVIEARKNGDFTSKEDLLRRTKLSSTNVKFLDELGALGDLSESDQCNLFDFNF